MMRPASLLLLILAGCAGPATKPAAPPDALPPAANLEVVVHEVVAKAEEEGTGQAKVFIDGQPAGETETGPRSKEKSWTGSAVPGNRLVRVEYWILEGLGSWARLPDDQQPRERFVRVEAGSRTRVALRFFDRARQNSISVSRQALP